MAGREHWISRGATPEQLPHALRWDDHLSGLGWSRDQIDRFIEWGLQQDTIAGQRPSAFDRETFIDSAHAMGEELGVPIHEMGIAQETFERVASEGWPEEPQPQESDVRYTHPRILEIEREMKKPRADSAYWRNDAAGMAMRDEYLQLLERGGGEATEAPAPSRRPLGDADYEAIAELEIMMRERSGPYWTGPLAEHHQAEYRELIERAQPPADTTDGGE